MKSMRHYIIESLTETISYVLIIAFLCSIIYLIAMAGQALANVTDMPRVATFVYIGAALLVFVVINALVAQHRDTVRARNMRKAEQAQPAKPAKTREDLIRELEVQAIKDAAQRNLDAMQEKK